MGSRAISRLLLAAAAVLLPLGMLAGWASSTLYDSDTFSQRVTSLLRSDRIRHEIGIHLTDKLAEGGYQQAVNFRPGLELAIEEVAGSEGFQSIFREAVARTHRDLLVGEGEGVNLSRGIGVIASTLQLPDNARPGTRDAGSFGKTFADAVDRLERLHFWRLQSWTHALWVIGLFGGLAAAAGGIALAANRVRAVQHLGWIVLSGGVVLVLVVLGLQWYVASAISDAELAAAVRDGVGRWTGDLRNIGLWMAGYGVVVAAAASAASGRRQLTPAAVVSSVGVWVERRRASTRGVVAMSAVGIVAGLALIRYHGFWLAVSVFLAGLWLLYLSVVELVGLARRSMPAAAEPSAPHHHRLRMVASVTAPVLALLSVGLVLTTRGAVQRAHAGGQPICNGEATLCDMPLNLVMLPATHNSMSSVRYPGWLQAEHFKTIREQLESGVRALLIDTHYGIPSAARMPGSETQLVITDRANELVAPTEADADPRIVERAQRLAARTQPAAGAKRGLYLCHNWCEMGAIRFTDGLAEVKGFLDSHPSEVVILDIEDHTRAPETAAAIEKAGLADRAYTLDPKAPLPTLGTMIAEGKNLLVFAESGGPGAPPWYQPAYEHWVQETPYAFAAKEEMNCGPNRGPADAPLFLVNHWIEAAPPDPRKAQEANTRAFLETRLRRCFQERGLVPNLVAVDFSERGDLLSTLDDVDDGLRAQFRAAQGRPSRYPARPAPTTPPDQGRTPGTSTGITPLPPIPESPVLATLTGGDPAAFCGSRAFNTADEVVSSWGEAHYVALPSEEGLPDLVYGPGAVRALDAIAGSAPAEIAQLLVPTRERAQAAVQTLTDLGLSAEKLDGQALDALQLGVRVQGEPATPNTFESVWVANLYQTLGAERVNAAGQGFAASHPAGPGLFVLGDVPADVARAAGFTCLLPDS